MVILIGVSVRLLLLVRWPRRLNGDEATAGLMGLHILRGEFPVFMYSVAYQGTPESYLTAVVYMLVGASPLTVKTAVFLVSNLLMVVAFLMGKRMGGWPGGLCCALLVAIAPPFLPLYGNYPMLGYMEVVVVGSLVLLLTLDVVTDHTGRALRSRKLLVLGLLAGLGWWINPMMVSYLAAAGIFLLLSWRGWSVRELGAAGLLFLLGSLPFWIFNLTHSFWSFVLFRKGGEGDFVAGATKAWSLLLEIAGVQGVLTDPVPFLSPAAGVTYLCLLGVLLGELGGWMSRDGPDAIWRRRGIQLLIFFSLLHLAAFSVSEYTEVAVQRYLFPLYSSIPILAGIAILVVWRRSRILSVAALVVLLLNNGLALRKTVQVFDANLRQDWWKPEPVVELLRRKNITRAYAELQIAPRLSFEALEELVVANPVGERNPEYLGWVDDSRRVAYILSPRLDINPTRFESSLRAIGADYQRKDFGEFSVFYDLHPPFDGHLVSVPPAGWGAQGSPSAFDPARAFDRDVDTAWFSGAPMRPGMTFQLDLRTVARIAGVTFLPVRTHFGIPSGYRVELSRDGRSWDVVSAVPEFVETLRWRNGQPRLDRTGDVVSTFTPRPVRYIRITQTGENPREWWAIAEVFVRTVSSSPVARVPEAQIRLLEGARFENEGRLASAVAAYERVVELDPELDEAHSGLARVYARAGLPVEGSDPHRRASVFANLGVWVRAARQYESLLEQNADHLHHSDFLTRLLAIYRQYGAGDQVARIERRLVEDYAPPIRAEARFGKSVKLLGYGLRPYEPRPGGVLELAYYWMALQWIPEDLSIFVHFRLDDQIRLQQDHAPLAGRYPTSRWREGERIRESYRLRLPRDLPPGEYEIRIGVWNPKTGERLRVTDTSLPDFRDAVGLATVRILPSR